MSLQKTTEDKKLDVLHGAVQALSVSAPQNIDPVTLKSMEEVDAVAKTALDKTEYPLSYRKQMPNEISTEVVPTAAKVEAAVQNSPVLAQEEVQSVFDLSSNKSARAPQRATRTFQTEVEQMKAEDKRALLEVLQSAEGELLAKQKEIPNLTVDQMAEELAKSTEQKVMEAATRKFPNVAREILMLGLKVEDQKTKELEKYKEDGIVHQKKIQDFLQLGKYLDALTPNQPNYNLKEAVLDKLSEPDRTKIELCIKEAFATESFDITKEQLAGGKARVNDLMGERKTAMTNILTTDISRVIHFLQMLMQIVQSSLRLSEKLHSKIIDHTGGR